MNSDPHVYVDLRPAPLARTERLTVDGTLQIAIVVLSLVAAYLVAGTGPLAKWGFVVGLVSQPFYLVATWRARQWGMLLVAIFYCGAWVQGILNRF